MKRKILLFITTIALVGCSSATTTQPSNQQPKEDKPRVDNADYTTLQIGDCLLDIPSYWEDKAPNYYAEQGNGTTLFYIDDTQLTIQPHVELEDVKNDYFQGLSSTFTNVHNENIQKLSINEIDGFLYIFDSTLQNIGLHTEVFIYLNPSNNVLIALMFGQADTSSYDHIQEFHDVLASLRINAQTTAQNDDSNENTPLPTSEDTHVDPIDDSDMIYTIENSDELKEILTAKHLDDPTPFVKKFNGKTIEFDAVVSYIEPSDNDWVATYVFSPVTDEGVGCSMFIMVDAMMFDFKWDDKTRPSYLEPGSKVRFRAKIISGDDPLFIYIDPECTWGQ